MALQADLWTQYVKGLLINIILHKFGKPDLKAVKAIELRVSLWEKHVGLKQIAQTSDEHEQVQPEKNEQLRRLGAAEYWGRDNAGLWENEQ